MSDIEDLEHKPITDMSPDEAIEHLRQIRLSRRIPVKKVKKSSSKKTTKKKTKELTADQAASLLKLIETLEEE
jgi:hypothetical protein